MYYGEEKPMKKSYTQSHTWVSYFSINRLRWIELVRGKEKEFSVKNIYKGKRGIGKSREKF